MVLSFVRQMVLSLCYLVFSYALAFGGASYQLLAQGPYLKAEKLQTASAYLLDTQPKKLIYREEHRLFYGSQGLEKTETKYLDSKGVVFADLESDYTEDPLIPTYTFRDFRFDYREGVLREGGKTYIFYQEKSGEIQKKVLHKKERLYAGQGWHYYLLDHLSLFDKGDLHLFLALPGRLNDYEFTLRRENTGFPHLVVNLEIRNWLLSMFVPTIELTYDRQRRRLLSYKGPSNIKSDKEEQQKVSIIYHYDEMGDR